MAQAARKPCTYPGCRVLAEPGGFRCKAHPPQAWTKRPEVKRTLVGRRRQETRDRIARLRPWCPYCEEAGRLQLGVILDHRVPIADGGGDEDENLQMICHDHNREKTARESRAGR